MGRKRAWGMLPFFVAWCLALGSMLDFDRRAENQEEE